MAEFVRVAAASEIPPGEMTIVEVDGQEIAIANLNGEFVAFQNECTHRGGPLGARARYFPSGIGLPPRVRGRRPATLRSATSERSDYFATAAIH